MKISEVSKGVVVLHQRQNQAHLRARAVRKVGVVSSNQMVCAARSDKADLVQVDFVLDGRIQQDCVRYNKLQVLPQSEMPIELAALVSA
jgi:hypothetical protein